MAFILGLLIGGSIGIAAMSMCFAARRGDEIGK